MEQRDFDIRQFVRAGKAMVVELDDEVEYIIDAKAVMEIEADDKLIHIIRTVDRTPQAVSARRIRWAIYEKGIIDYLDTENV